MPALADARQALRVTHRSIEKLLRGMPLKSRRMSPDTPDFYFKDAVSNSFRDYHTKGFDYLCLFRSPQYTVKVYYLDGDASKLPEVVNPHDHRYYFRTTVLAGRMVDYRFVKDDRGEVYNAFDYRTPLNGGDGFTFRGEERLLKSDAYHLNVGQRLHSPATDLHTIQMKADQTVLLLEQFEDVMPLDAVTSCWSRKGDVDPDASGMYSEFTEDTFRERCVTIQRLINRSL